MRANLLSCLAQTALVIFLALTVVFVLVRLAGDPVLLFLPMDIQVKDLNEFRQRLGFNDPLIVQYGRFIAGAVRGSPIDHLDKPPSFHAHLRRLQEPLLSRLARLVRQRLGGEPRGPSRACRS